MTSIIPQIPFIPEALNPFLSLPYHLQLFAAIILMIFYVSLAATFILWWVWTIFERVMERHDSYFAYMRSKK